MEARSLIADREDRVHEERPPAALPTPAVLLSGVTRLYRRTPALRQVDLRIERGEVVVVRGPNGAGKTTLLRVIATAAAPTYGTGSVLGFDLLRGRDAIRARTQLLGHRTGLYEDLTGTQNLRLACTMHGLAPQGIRAALDRAGLTGAAEEPVRSYSRGMRQRLALARVFLRNAELQLLDEPYAGLDEQGKDLVDDLIDRSARDGRTVVIATHEATRGEPIGREIWIDAGRIRAGQEPR